MAPKAISKRSASKTPPINAASKSATVSTAVSSNSKRVNAAAKKLNPTSSATLDGELGSKRHREVAEGNADGGLYDQAKAFIAEKLDGARQLIKKGTLQALELSKCWMKLTVPQDSKPTLVPLHRLAECKFGLKHLRVENSPVQGLQGLAKKVKDMIATENNMKDTISLVVMNASGVGKTFSSLAVETLLNTENNPQDNQNDPKRFYMPLYIGFSSGFSLTGPESDLLEDKSLKAYERVCGVIGRRLLYQLRMLDSTKGSLSEVLTDETHWLAKTPQPADDTFATECRFPMVEDNDEEPFIKECARLIEKLAERCGDRKLSLLLIIDHGQLLDRYVQLDDRLYGGARFALLFGRRLQRILVKAGRASLLPIMTGVGPVTNMPDGKAGRNVEFSEPLLEFTDYRAALEAERKDLVKEKMRNVLTPSEVHRIAALLYPELRNALSFVRQELIMVHRPQVITPLWLVATCASYPLKREYWDTRVPAIFKEDSITFIPKLSLAQFVKMVRIPFTFLAQSVHLVLQKMNIEFSKVEEMRKGWLRNGFEEYSFYVLTLLFAMANVAPVEEYFSDYHGITASEAFRDYEMCRNVLRIKSRWLGNSFKRVGFLFAQDSGLRSDIESCFLPSCYAVTHDEAFKLKDDGTCEHELHDALRILIKRSLLDSGDCFALWCGGETPVGFVWIIRKSAKDARSVEVEVCLADAKHRQKVSPLSGSRGEVDLPKQFLMVANYLEAALKAECGMTVVEERFGLITNIVAANTKARIITNRAGREAGKKDFGAIDKKVFGNTHVYARFEATEEDLNLGDEVEMLTRDTFNIPPLSEFIFGPEDME